MDLGNSLKSLFGTGKKEETNVNNEKIEEANEKNNKESIENKKEINKKASKHNFKYLDNLIHSGTEEIILDSDIVLDEDENPEFILGIKRKSELNSGIKLDVDDLIIDGAGHSIDACGKIRIFFCTGKNITIKNITLKNAMGSAIINHGELTIEESAFKNNNGREAGAILNMGNLTITGSTFNKNNGKLTGGIFNGGKLSIIKSILNKNKGMNTGGIFNFANGKTTITESAFQENIGKNAKAINNGGKLIITESKIVHNKKTGHGIPWTFKIRERQGAVISNGGELKIFNCEILSNESKYIILNEEFLKIYNTLFRKNKTEYIILNDDFGDIGISNLSIFNDEFIENNAEVSVIQNNGKSCVIDRAIFDKNISQKNSNNIVNNSELTLRGLKIKDDGKTIFNNEYIFIRDLSHELKRKIYGKGVVENPKIISIQEQKFDFEYLDKKIHENKTKKISLEEDIRFEKYEMDYYEGGIELDIDNLVIDGKGHTIDGAGKSRIFLITGKNIKLKNITFKNGYSYKDYDNCLNNNGGAIKTNYKTNLTIENCKFLNNTTQDEGGAIHNHGDIDVIKTIFDSNKAGNNGGAVCNYAGLSIKQSTLTNNLAYKEGGAIRNYARLSIKQSTLTNNTSKLVREVFNIYRGEGGAIHNDGELTVTESKLTENTTKLYGGAIHNHGNMDVIKTIFDSNKAEDNGGAIHNEGNLTVTESKLTENTTKLYGGAIHNEGELIITETTLLENTSERYCGAISLNKNKSKKYESNNCTFKNNKPNDVGET